MLSPPCVDVQGDQQAVCVAQHLVPAVSTPGINLRGLAGDPADVARLGVKIEVSQSDAIPPPEAPASLRRICTALACGMSKPLACDSSGLRCKFSALLVPVAQADKPTSLQDVTIIASSPAALERAKATIWYFTTIDNHWTYWSLAQIEANAAPGGLPPAGNR